MPGRPFRSRLGISGPQPTHSALGKAKGSQWGTKRAKPGQRIGRIDAFPEDGGHKLVLTDSDEEEEEGLSTKRRRATSSAGTAARALAASKRASFTRSRPRSPSLDGIPSDVSSVSSHSSDSEPDSDNPDRESSKQSRWREKAEEAQSKKEGKQRVGTGARISGNSDMDEIRRKRAEAAEKRLQQDKTITIDGTDTEEEREYQERKQKERDQEKGKGKSGEANGKGKRKEVGVAKKIVKKGKSVIVEKRKSTKSTEQNGLGDLEHQIFDMPPAMRNRYLKEEANKREVAPPRASTSRRRSSASSSPEPEPRSRPQLFNRSPSVSSDDEDLVHPDDIGTDRARETRRRRTQGNKKRSSTGFKIQTGASGSGSAATFTAGGKGGGRDDNDSIFKPRKHSKQRREPSRSLSPPAPPARRRAAAAPSVPGFVDPRVDLAKRKARELSDPPTDAFSSSNGESDDDDENGKKKKRNRGGGKRKKGEDDLLDDIERMEREMNRRKRIYREERRPGYSNPRKN